MRKRYSPKFSVLLIGIVVLVLSLLLRWYAHHNLQQNDYYFEHLQSRINATLTEVEKDALKIVDIISESTDHDFVSLSEPTSYPYFIFLNGRLAYWSDFRFVPGYSNLTGDYKYKLKNLERGQFLVRRDVLTFQGQSLELFQLVPVYYYAKIDNNYLRSGYNTDLFPSEHLLIYDDPVDLRYHIDAPDENYLFSVVFEDAYRLGNEAIQILVLILFALAFGLVATYITMWINRYTRLKYFGRAFSMLLATLVVVRALMIYFDFPFAFFEIPLFNPKFYASSAINASVGDLLLNVVSILLVTLYIFRNYKRFYWYRHANKLSAIRRTIAAATISCLSFFAMAYQFYVLRSLFSHSQWSFDITSSINFTFPKSVAIAVVFLSAVIYFLWAHLLYKIFVRISHYNRMVMLANFLAGGVVFITISNLASQSFIIIALVNLLYYAVLVLLQLPKSLDNVKYITFIYFFISAFFSAMMGAYTVYNFELIRNSTDKQRFANQLLIERDIWGESLLQQVGDRIQDDIFIKNRLFGPYSKDPIEQKIRRAYLSSYFDKYDVQVYIFNSRGEPYGNQINSDYDDLLDIYDQSDYLTDYDDLYFVNDIGPNIDKRYVQFIPLKRYGINIGYIVLELKLKKIIPNSVYPELLVDKRFMQPYFNRAYSYAIYSDDQVIYNAGSFNYIREFDAGNFENRNLYDRGIIRNGFHHYGILSDDARLIVISNEFSPINIVGSNFAFLFLIFVFIIIFLLLIYTLYFILGGTSLNFSTKIQLYLNSSFFIPLLVLSITTLSLISTSYKDDVTRRYFRRAENISANTAGQLDDFNQKLMSQEELSTILGQAARYVETDLNLFNTNGQLIATSQPIIYSNEILSEYINPFALAEIRERNANRIILDESVGSLSFKNTYVGVKSYETGQLIGILSIPFFESEYELDRQIIEVLTNIMNIFAFIFIIFLGVSYFASKLLTYPLQYIASRIRRLSLSAYNEPLQWNSDDEIGILVSEYNRMLLNLEESKKALSRSEKESAWREMAKQVAHEIKNPLTPMKLTLQHLRRMLMSKEDADESTERPINTLLHQVDTLNDIATSFATFAHMPVPINEQYDVVAVLKKTVNLHENEEANIEASVPEKSVFVMGDAQLMGRIFSNLIINGIQSVSSHELPQIMVRLSTDEHKVTIEIKDNGDGIDEAIQEKVFVPNFSTKYSGSGIGLAIAKRGIEHAGGAIWFETRHKIGTSFFIELPLVDA